MMFISMIVAFVIGYTCIIFENLLHIHKTATALLLAVILWVMFTIGDCCSVSIYKDFSTYCKLHFNINFTYWLTHILLIKYLGKISEILFFLLGTMTIVEIINVYGGFRLITSRIHATKKKSLMWIIGLFTFILSAILDNLTISIIMTTLLKNLIDDKKERWFFGSMIVLSANAGGIWSPIGDVTTIMLWIAGKISSNFIIVNSFLPALTSIVVPLGILSFAKNKTITCLKTNITKNEIVASHKIINFMFFSGIGTLLFVPVFKIVTNLPPYLGILGGLSILWIASEILNKNSHNTEQEYLSVYNILKRIDIPSILFFFSILMAIDALLACGQLDMLSNFLNKIFMKEPNKYYLISIIIGLFSSIIDNIPLVASSIEMYQSLPSNHYFWAFLAYTAGSGGSLLLIGSSAGIAVMGIEKIDFIWYLKKISWVALIGYLCGCFVYIFQQILF